MKTREVTMGAAEWRAEAQAAREAAVGWLHNEGVTANRMAEAARMLEASFTFDKFAGRIDNEIAEPVTASVEFFG